MLIVLSRDTRITFDPESMDALTAYDSNSSGGEEEVEAARETEKDEVASFNTEESSTILSRLKEKFPLNSAPSVPIRVSPGGR